MSDNLNIRINATDAQELLRSKTNLSELWQRKVAPKLHKEMQVRVDSVFQRNRRGGRHRGLYWKPPAIQYVRKDGTRVSAEGGVRKVRGRGLVKGRKRPSGARWSASSALVQDTMTLRGRALTSKRITAKRLVMGSNVRYSRHQHEQRPWASFHLPDDLEMAQGILTEAIMKKHRRR